MDFSNSNFVAAIAVATAVWMCGLTSVQAQLKGLAVQNLAMAGVCLLVGNREHESRYLLLAAAIVLVKGIAIPGFLSWAAERLNVRRDLGVAIGPAFGLAFGCVALAVGLTFGRQISSAPSVSGGAAGVAMALVLIGMLLMITRRLALSQLVGLLTLENGIFLFGMTQTRGMPMMVEMGAVFEVFVGVLIGGLVLFRLNRSFEHIDVTDLRRLRR